MRDDRHKWQPVPDEFPPLTYATVSVSVCNVGHQYLLSGLSVSTHNTGSWPSILQGEKYTLRLRRDQILEVGGTGRDTGWHSDHAFAVSDMTDGYQVISVSGTGAFDLLCRGAELDLNIASGSVARHLWDFSALLYRYEHAQSYRIHIERSNANALYWALEAAAKGMQ